MDNESRNSSLGGAEMKVNERLKLLLSREEHKEQDDRLLFYDIDRISAMVENDEISAEESGFMQGYMEAETL